MATVTGLTATRMLEIEAASIVSGSVNAEGRLILVHRDGSIIDAGYVKGAPGDNVDAKSYSDAGDVATLQTAEQYSDAMLVSAKSYADNLVSIKLIGNAEDLNNYATTGVFAQQSSAQAVAGLNYPVPTVAGILEVFVSGSFVWQRYTPYGSYSSTIFTRARYAGTWAVWAALGNPLYAIQASAATVSPSVLTALSFAAAPLSPSSSYVRATNRITVPSAGTYSVNYRFHFSSSIGTTRAFVELTVASTASYQYSIPADTVSFSRVIVTSDDTGVAIANVSLKAGAQIGLNAYHTTSTSKGIDGVLNIQRTV